MQTVCNQCITCVQNVYKLCLNFMLKSYRVGWVAHEILVSAQGLFFGFGTKGLGGLTIQFFHRQMTEDTKTFAFLVLLPRRQKPST